MGKRVIRLYGEKSWGHVGNAAGSLRGSERFERSIVKRLGFW